MNSQFKCFKSFECDHLCAEWGFRLCINGEQLLHQV